ncbi:hypothetical protein [Marinifilum sp.]|uniref:hypothetical protein n=1 Tax=Marinifilum sp. TaxID=2033137 RepID=UPI003BAD45C4
MKRYIYLFVIVATVFSCLFTSCDDNEDKFSDVMDGADLGSAIPFTKFQTPKIFDVTDLGNYKMEFELNVGAVGEGLTYKSIIVNKSFNGGDTIQHDQIAAADIPFVLSITAADAITGFEGVTIDNVKGGDFIDWIFLVEFADGTNGNYADEAANSFPNFTSFFASPLDFEFADSYTQTVLETNVPNLVTSVLENQTISTVPGTARSQYLVQDISCGILNAAFGIGDLNYRLFYIGDNKFALNAGSEAFPTAVLFAGDVELDPATGVMNFDVFMTDASCCGLAGMTVKFKMEPNN